MEFKHLEEVNESYIVHMAKAVWYSCKLTFAAASCLVHAVYPDVCQDTASNICAEIVDDVYDRRWEATNSKKRHE